MLCTCAMRMNEERFGKGLGNDNVRSVLWVDFVERLSCNG